MKNMIKNMIIERRKNKPIRFDVFMDDRGDNDWGKPMLANVGYIEACAYIGQASHFSFKVTEHGKPKNVFLTGYCNADMRTAEEGDLSVSLGWATKKQAEKIYGFLKKKQSL